MRIDIVNGTIIAGDGKSVFEGASVIIENGLIVSLPRVRYIPYNAYADKVINAQNGLILPGVINIHAHGITFGPFFPYGWKRLSEERIVGNLNTHLLQGTTTLLNGDGLALPSEVDAVNKMHPVNVKTCTLHTPQNIRAGDVTAGQGIQNHHRRFTAEEAVRQGAVAIGEVGSPGTAYGTFEKGIKLGQPIPAQCALALDKAVFSGKEDSIRKALDEAHLGNITTEEAKNLVHETSVLPVEACCEAILESIEYARKLDVPVLAHAEPSTMDAVLEAAKALGPKLIAVHVNHTFSAGEAVGLAKQLRRYGSIVEIISADVFGARQVEASPEVTFALLKDQLVDVITTDFSGGYHDPILLVLQRAVEAGILTLARAVHLATAAPAGIVPGVAPNRGLIEPGKVADLCVVERDNWSKVRYVIIGGRLIVEEGKIP